MATTRIMPLHIGNGYAGKTKKLLAIRAQNTDMCIEA